MNNINLESKTEIKPSLKQHHLKTIETAKQFIHDNYSRNISLFEVAENCFVSPFHFGRLFKIFTGISPHQYLLKVRLKNADVKLRTTSLSVTQVCFESGFNNLDHFSTAFKKKYKIQPSGLRRIL